MIYLVGEQFNSQLGNLSCQLLGSVNAPNKKQAEWIAEQRWPDREYCIYEMPKRSTPMSEPVKTHVV